MNKNNAEFDILAIFALGISLYIASIGRQNLEYNKKNTETSNKIAYELKRLNDSNLISKIDKKITESDKNDN